MDETRTEERISIMTIALRLLSAGLAAASALALAGCMSGGPGQPPLGSAPKSGVDGSWVDAQGTGVSTFSAAASRRSPPTPARSSPTAATG
jgi:hypothetical protein